MAVIAHRPKAVELSLIQAGYTLADIRGEREVHRYEEQPQGLAAAVGRVSPRSALLAAAGVMALGLFLAYETGLVSPVAASVALAYGLHTLGQVDSDPVEVEHEVHRPGMTHHEVQQRMVQWHEWKRLEKKEQEKQAKKARKAGKNPSSTRRT